PSTPTPTPSTRRSGSTTRAARPGRRNWRFRGPRCRSGRARQRSSWVSTPRRSRCRRGGGAAPHTTPPTPARTAAGSARLRAGGSWEAAYVVYAGPKEYDHLHRVGLEESINFGGFPVPRECGGLPMRWFAVPILLFMNWLNAHVHNYGLAIILLTVLSKALFYPLTVWSMRSMKSMQSLQPQVNALRSKYKSDPQRAQRETMELYRKHGVNPGGGCPPMLPQIPIFYALYLAVANSAELQNAPFLCSGFLQPVARG